jgi:hypothetical protein
LAPLLLRLAAARRTPAGPAEGTLGTAAATTAARTRRATAGSGAGSAAATGTTAAGTRTAAATGPAATAAATRPRARSGTRAATACAGTAPACAGRRGAGGHVHRAGPGTAGTRTREPAGTRAAVGHAGTLGPTGTASARTGPAGGAGGAAGRTGTAFPARRARALGPRRRRGTHPGRGRAERVVTGPGAGTRGTGTRTRSAGPGRPGTGSTRSLRPGRGRAGTLTALILTASGSAGALAALAIARRARTRRRGPGAARPLAPARAAEVGRGGRGARRTGHPRGAGPLLGPRFGRLGDRRRRDRRQLRGRRVSRIRWRRGAGRGGAIGRSRSLRRTVGRPVGHGPGGGGGSGHGVAGTLRCRHRASAGPRPGAARGRAVARRGLTARPGPGILRTLTALISLGGLIRSLSRKCFLEPPDHGRLDRRGRRPYELAHFLELIHDGLALDTELFREFVNPDLRHYAPSRPSPLDPLPDPGPGRACSGRASAYGDHRRVLIERSSASRPAFRQVFLLAFKACCPAWLFRRSHAIYGDCSPQRYSASGSRLSGPAARKARGNARRRRARSRQARLGCTYAPRPGSRARGSGWMTSPAATRRSRLDLTTRSLQPTQVRIAGIPGTCRLARVAMTSLSLPRPRVSGYAREPEPIQGPAPPDPRMRARRGPPHRT